MRINRTLVDRPSTLSIHSCAPIHVLATLPNYADSVTLFVQDNLAEIVREGGVEKLMEAELILQVGKLSSFALSVAAPQKDLGLITACFVMLFKSVDVGSVKGFWTTSNRVVGDFS